MNSNIIEDAEHGADCRCNECLFEGPEVESADELVAKGWLKPKDVERTKPPVVLHRLPLPKPSPASNRVPMHQSHRRLVSGPEAQNASKD